MRTLALLYHLQHHRMHSRMLPTLYSAFTVRVILFSFISVFLPIFYYQRFLSFFHNQQVALAAVFVAFACVCFLHMFAGFFAGKIAYKYGVRTNFLIAMTSLVVYIVAIGFFNGLTSIYVSIVALAVHLGFWWHTYHLIMLHANHKDHFGRSWGMLEGVAILVGVITPFLAGTIAQRYGFAGLFSGSLFIVLSLFAIVIMLKDTYRTQPVTLELAQKEIKKHKKEFVAFLGAGMEIGVLEHVWPLILFTLFKELVYVGAAASLVALVGFISAILIGRLVDRLPKDKLQHWGGVCVAASWLGKLIFQTPFGAVFWDSWHRTLGSLFYIPLTVISYIQAGDQNDNSYLFMREFGFNLAKTAMLVICAVLVWKGVSLWWLLSFAVVGPLLSLGIQKIVIPTVKK